MKKRFMSRKPTSRYTLTTGVEAEAEPGSRGRVLRNRLGITRKRVMEEAEYDALLRAQERFTQEIAADTRFTAAHLCQMHRDWLGDIYDWAGRYRTVELAKEDFRWPPAAFVAQNMTAFEEGLLRRHTPCPPGPLPEVARHIAEVHAELLLIHPFREGNGRLARWLADLMALQAGLPAPDYPFFGRGAAARRARYLEAVKAGYLSRYEPLSGFFVEVLEAGLRDGG